MEMLPEEVQARIISYLGFKDRRNVQLVCKLWAKEVNRAIMAANERFQLEYHDVNDYRVVFDTGVKMNVVKIIVPKCASGLQDSDFFVIRGPDIEAITVLFDYSCPIVLFDIFKYCVNLKNLSVMHGFVGTGIDCGCEYRRPYVDNENNVKRLATLFCRLHSVTIIDCLFDFMTSYEYEDHLKILDVDDTYGVLRYDGHLRTLLYIHGNHLNEFSLTLANGSFSSDETERCSNEILRMLNRNIIKLKARIQYTSLDIVYISLKFPKLQELFLYRCFGLFSIHYDLGALLPNLKFLTRLGLANAALTIEDVDAIRSVPLLTRIKLVGCSFVGSALHVLITERQPGLFVEFEPQQFY